LEDESIAGLKDMIINVAAVLAWIIDKLILKR